MSKENIQDEIEDDVRKVFNKMEKTFHEYFGKHCPTFDPECYQCKANLIFSNFKKKLWDEHVKDTNPSVSAPNHSPQELPTALKASSPSSVGVIGNEDTSKSKGCGKMYCAECGEIDKLHSAYCIEHGRSTHKICGDGGYCKDCRNKDCRKKSLCETNNPSFKNTNGEGRVANDGAVTESSPESKGCGKKEKVWKGIGDNYWNAVCGKPILYEKESDGTLIPCKIHLCKECEKPSEDALKEFNNSKEAYEYLKDEAEEGETIILDEVATSYRPRRIRKFSKKNFQEQDNSPQTNQPVEQVRGDNPTPDASTIAHDVGKVKTVDTSKSKESNHSQGKKDGTTLGKHLETRSEAREDIDKDMLVDTDNHLDTSKLKESKIADELNKDYVKK